MKLVLEFDNIETVKRAVEIENGVSIVPEAAMQAEVETGAACRRLSSAIRLFGDRFGRVDSALGAHLACIAKFLEMLAPKSRPNRVPTWSKGAPFDANRFAHPKRPATYCCRKFREDFLFDKIVMAFTRDSCDDSPKEV